MLSIPKLLIMLQSAFSYAMITRLLTVVLCCLRCVSAYSQPGANDMRFDPGTGANQVVLQSAQQADGKVIAVGTFTFFNDVNYRYVVRLQSDGSIDSGFNSGNGPNGLIRTLQIQPDGKIFLAGNFTSYNGVSRNRLVRVHSDGTLDTSFKPGSGANNGIFASALQPDGKIIIVGEFFNVAGVSINRIARLHADGRLDSSFTPGTGASGIIRSVALQPDGKIIIGGFFTAYNGVTVNRIARLNSDGTLDQTFNMGSGCNGTVRSIALQPDGKIVLAGDFTAYNAITRNFVLRLFTDGSLDQGFNSGSGPNGWIGSVALQQDGKLLIGGNFVSYNAISYTRFLRLNADGSPDTTFQTGTGPDNNVLHIAIQRDGHILISGEFWMYRGINRKGIARVLVCQPSTSVDKVTACNSYRWIDGNTYTTTNNTATFTLTGGAASGCDSVMTLDLTMRNSGESTDVQSACNSYTWLDGISYTSSNQSATYTIAGGAANGCDSLIRLDLTITTIDTSVQYRGSSLKANEMDAIYQWLDCEKEYASIEGETNALFEVGVTGTYAVAITKNNCTDTSGCFIVFRSGVSSIRGLTLMKVYPNPFSTQTTLSFGRHLANAEVVILNALGQVVASYNNIHGNSYSIPRERLSEGLYQVVVIQNDQRMMSAPIIIVNP
jgi:uncharacterized delta-60 repeat protein